MKTSSFHSGSQWDSQRDRLITIAIVAVIWGLLAAMIWLASLSGTQPADYYDYWMVP
jgi:hypothetical protein